MFRKYTVLICIVAFALFANSTYANSTASLIDKGNKSWVSGDYEEAINKYDEAAVDDPESPYIHFNKGTALYKKGDYSAAIESFEKAALKSKKPEMESKSRFNLGNCTFREAEKQMDSDLKKSLEYCQKSIIHFQDALKLDPGNKKASENVEIVRLVMKNILDEIKKKEQEAKENAEKIKQLIKRQEEALDKNRQISKDELKPDEEKQKLNKLADEQKDITRDTQEFVENISSQAAQQNQGEENQALKHLNNAVKEQTAAEGNLRNSETGDAKKNQENAINELKESLKPPEQNQDNQDNQDNQGQDDQKEQQDQQENQKQSSEEKQQQGEEQPENEDQAAMKKASEDAQEILDEEKENKKQRRIMSSGGYRDVEKDW